MKKLIKPELDPIALLIRAQTDSERAMKKIRRIIKHLTDVECFEFPVEKCKRKKH